MEKEKTIQISKKVLTFFKESIGDMYKHEVFGICSKCNNNTSNVTPCCDSDVVVDGKKHNPIYPPKYKK